MDRNEFIFIGSAKQVNIDKIDDDLLKILSSNARISIIELAEILKVSSTTIRYRVRKLEQIGVIRGYRIAIDPSLIGYKDFRIDVDLKDFTKRDIIFRYITRNPNLTYIFTSIGHADVQFHVRVEKLDDVHIIMSNLNAKFPDAIRDYKYVYIPKIYKQNYMPGE